jgi:hypothetical protein
VFCKNEEIYAKLTLDMYLEHLRTQLALDDGTYSGIEAVLKVASSLERVAEQLEAQLRQLQAKNAMLRLEIQAKATNTGL